MTERENVYEIVRDQMTEREKESGNGEERERERESERDKCSGQTE